MRQYLLPIFLAVLTVAYPVFVRVHLPNALATTGSSATVTDTCAGAGTYRGWGNTACYTYATTGTANQKFSQDDTRNTNDSGSNQSSMMGMMALAMGAAMVAAGMAMLTPPTTAAGIALIMAGMALIAAGMMAMSAAGNMANNAGKADFNSGDLSNITGGTYGNVNTRTSTRTTPGNATVGTGASKGIKIDPALSRSGKIGSIFDDMEKKTGIGREDFMDRVNNGEDITSILASTDASKKGKFGEDKLRDALDKAKAGDLPSGNDLLNKMGMTPEELAALAKKNSGMSATGEDTSLNAAGGSRSPASGGSGSTPDINSLFPGRTEAPTPGFSANLTGSEAISPDLQAALDRQGITGRSIFQMVNSQYKKRTPMLFGVSERAVASPMENPFSDLNSGGAPKIEL
jgi:hypothetical protein